MQHQDILARLDRLENQLQALTHSLIQLWEVAQKMSGDGYLGEYDTRIDQQLEALKTLRFHRK